MRRDMNLVRSILERVEQAEYPVDADDLIDEAHELRTVVYHVKIMAQAGLLDASVSSDFSGNSYATVDGLTWDGQEFLSLVRQNTVWAKVRDTVKNKTGSLSFELLKAVALDVTRGLVLG